MTTSTDEAQGQHGPEADKSGERREATMTSNPSGSPTVHQDGMVAGSVESDDSEEEIGEAGSPKGGKKRRRGRKKKGNEGGDVPQQEGSKQVDDSSMKSKKRRRKGKLEGSDSKVDEDLDSQVTLVSGSIDMDSTSSAVAVRPQEVTVLTAVVNRDDPYTADDVKMSESEDECEKEVFRFKKTDQSTALITPSDDALNNDELNDDALNDDSGGSLSKIREYSTSCDGIVEYEDEFMEPHKMDEQEQSDSSDETKRIDVTGGLLSLNIDLCTREMSTIAVAPPQGVKTKQEDNVVQEKNSREPGGGIGDIHNQEAAPPVFNEKAELNKILQYIHGDSEFPENKVEKSDEPKVESSTNQCQLGEPSTSIFNISGSGDIGKRSNQSAVLQVNAQCGPEENKVENTTSENAGNVITEKKEEEKGEKKLNESVKQDAEHDQERNSKICTEDLKVNETKHQEVIEVVEFIKQITSTAIIDVENPAEVSKLAHDIASEESNTIVGDIIEKVILTEVILETRGSGKSEEALAESLINGSPDPTKRSLAGATENSSVTGVKEKSEIKDEQVQQKDDQKDKISSDEDTARQILNEQQHMSMLSPIEPAGEKKEAESGIQKFIEAALENTVRNALAESSSHGLTQPRYSSTPAGGKAVVGAETDEMNVIYFNSFEDKEGGYESEMEKKSSTLSWMKSKMRSKIIAPISRTTLPRIRSAFSKPSSKERKSRIFWASIGLVKEPVESGIFAVAEPPENHRPTQSLMTDSELKSHLVTPKKRNIVKRFSDFFARRLRRRRQPA